MGSSISFMCSVEESAEESYTKSPESPATLLLRLEEEALSSSVEPLQGTNPPCNTPNNEAYSTPETDLRESLHRLSVSFHPATSEILELAKSIEALDTTDATSVSGSTAVMDVIQDRASNEPQLPFQSPHVSRFGDGKLYYEMDDTLSSVGAGIEEYGVELEDDVRTTREYGDLTHLSSIAGTPCHQQMISSPYSDMTSVKSHMMATEVMVPQQNQNQNQNQKDDSPTTIDLHNISKPQTANRISTIEVEPEGTTNEASDSSNGCTESNEWAVKRKKLREAARETGGNTSMSSISTDEFGNMITTGPALKVKPGKKYTFRRRVGKAASLMMRTLDVSKSRRRRADGGGDSGSSLSSGSLPASTASAPV
jgi:hypothetical protein